MTKKVAAMFAILLLATACGLDFSEDDHSSTPPTEPGTTVLPWIDLVQLTAQADCEHATFPYELRAGVYRYSTDGTPETVPVLKTEFTCSDGFRGAGFSGAAAKHTFLGCGPVSDPTLGFDCRADITTQDGAVYPVGPASTFPCSFCPAE